MHEPLTRCGQRIPPATQRMEERRSGKQRFGVRRLEYGSGDPVENRDSNCFQKPPQTASSYNRTNQIPFLPFPQTLSENQTFPSFPLFLLKLEMSLSTHLFIFILTASFSVFFVIAQNHYKVGGDDGWRVPDENNPDFYTAWASKLRFQVGDSIVFEYKNDSVIRVEKRGYYHCNESSNDAEFKDGSTVFLFDKPGLFYFVSSNFEHCKKGQRLMVDVMASHGTPFPGAPGPSPHTSDAGPATAYGGSVTVSVVAFISLLMLKCGLKEREAAVERLDTYFN